MSTCAPTLTRVLKLLSEDPSNYPDAPREGIRRMLEQETGVPHPRDTPLDTSRIASIRMGTTVRLCRRVAHNPHAAQVATNALLERKGERVALVVTAGLRDLLHIGNQSRPAIFDLSVRCPDVLYETVIECDELVVLPLEDTPCRCAIVVYTFVTACQQQHMQHIPTALLLHWQST